MVERWYSDTLYIRIQPGLTALSNRVPFALFDALLVVVPLVWILLTMRDRFWRRQTWLKALGRLIVRTAVLAAVVYLGFLAVWGLNYRRVPLAEKLAFNADAITSDALSELVLAATAQVNGLHRAAHDAIARGNATDMDRAFAVAQAALGLSTLARTARPKTSLLDVYFRAAAVDGMTAPFTAETLVVSDLLDVERPFIVAHEWSHLAGFADEAEASFVGWLSCLEGSPLDRYSGWLFVYSEAVGELPVDERRAAAARLDEGPRADLTAITERRRRGVQPVVSRAGWEVYDRYLKANRVERGAESYGDVLKLILGTRKLTAPRPTS